MSHQYDQNRTPEAYPPPQSYPPPAEGYPYQGPYVVPPPAGYPMKDGHGYPQSASQVETKDRGDGFWKGCCAALCCCCVLDMCF
ncbi:PREDICTED: cysteine-rich and transmembrane domain-containing protein A-like [Nelumbo nucifera]|uniref:Cysteine-rich transmembrane domain-containing protein n=2 Tax=Nelumbo nucifera TaxID=4432 RepID=A0A822ZLM9_NELNU|nr:PREDICTED: cysteine-rich and transmembrane domain-containing protein A-like [Nelumbo nucifera]DAD43886.1 TPA_asm: hypothetical protein HUJ06_002117 [Nelumbo nucifera]